MLMERVQGGSWRSHRPSGVELSGQRRGSPRQALPPVHRADLQRRRSSSGKPVRKTNSNCQAAFYCSTPCFPYANGFIALFGSSHLLFLPLPTLSTREELRRGRGTILAPFRIAGKRPRSAARSEGRWRDARRRALGDEAQVPLRAAQLSGRSCHDARALVRVVRRLCVALRGGGRPPCEALGRQGQGRQMRWPCRSFTNGPFGAL